MIVTYETIRQWCAQFAPVYAAGLRRRQPRPGDKWHLYEVFLTINGRRDYLWRAVDQDGNVLDILVQCRRDGIVKLFGNACGAVDVSGLAGGCRLTASFKPLRR